MPKTESKQQLGVRGEDLACAELQRQGIQVLEPTSESACHAPCWKPEGEPTDDTPPRIAEMIKAGAFDRKSEG